MTLQPERVRDMFDRISPSYDRMNLLMSMGRDGCWRRLGVRASGVQPGDAALDVCCGTGDLTLELAGRVAPGGHVVGCGGAAAFSRRSPPALSRRGSENTALARA